jgi:hypothetical protein
MPMYARARSVTVWSSSTPSMAVPGYSAARTRAVLPPALPSTSARRSGTLSRGGTTAGMSHSPPVSAAWLRYTDWSATPSSVRITTLPSGARITWMNW